MAAAHRQSSVRFSVRGQDAPNWPNTFCVEQTITRNISDEKRNYRMARGEDLNASDAKKARQRRKESAPEAQAKFSFAPRRALSLSAPLAFKRRLIPYTQSQTSVGSLAGADFVRDS
jgi:hypothetical protein